VLRLGSEWDLTMRARAIEHHSEPISSDRATAPAFAIEDHGSRPPLPVSQRRTGIAGKLAWCAAGFLIGAAFWHVVGFWSFISYVVLGGPDGSANFVSPQIVSVASADQAPAPPALAAKGRPACITLALDRATGETRPEPCEASALALPHIAASAREDLASLPERSSPTILPHSGVAPTSTTLSD
jgi:hypothetical protein